MSGIESEFGQEDHGLLIPSSSRREKKGQA